MRKILTAYILENRRRTTAMAEYAVSIITPFYNVEENVFKKCCESVIRQTIGFDRIEWIVVVHNSGEEYLEYVRKLLGEYGNVKICVLNDGKKTPSAPRNYGLKQASAPYVGFLDADDRFTPRCLQTVLAHIKRSKSQIAWFRREFELETEDATPITEIVLWDQTRDEIIVDKDNWDDKKMFSGICGMVTSRLYERAFLEKNGIIFDEMVPFGEDYLFNLECYGHADRICYLPQTIGYHYFINGASLVQERKKSPETLIAFARGYKKIFDTGLKYGFFMNAIISGLCCVLARFMIASDTLTLEDRKLIRDILKPYIEHMEPLEVSKLYPQKAVRERYEFPRAVILQPDNYVGDSGWDTLIAVDVTTSHILSPYQRMLREIIDLNSTTDMGRRYGIMEVLTLTGFQSAVPVTEYDVYEPLIRLQTNIGESGIITSDPIKSYIYIPGNMGNAKFYPCTDRQIRPIVRLFNAAVTGHRTFLMLEALPRCDRFNDNTYVNTQYGSLLAGLLSENDAVMHDRRKLFTAPVDVLFPSELADLTYVRLLFALRDPDVDRIMAPNTWEIWKTLLFLEKNWRGLCDDIRNGSIGHYNEVISPEFAETITGHLKPDPERAAELESIFQEGFDTPILQRVWKTLGSIVACSDGCFRIYAHNLKRYLGDEKIQIMNGLYLDVLAYIGKETDKCGEYRLCARNAFVEFMPEDGSADKVCLAPFVEPGRRYYPVISTFSGLYRYRLHNVVRILRMEDDEPVFTVEYDSDQTIRPEDVRLTDLAIENSVLAMSDRTGVRITDYAYLENENNNGLIVFVETPGDDVSGIDMDELAAVFEEQLEKESEDYKNAVREGRLVSAEVAFIEDETQLFYRDMLMFRSKFPTDFIKPVRYVDTPIKEKFFRSRVL